MYEDKRSIDGNGLLSQRTKPAYTPQPVRLQFTNPVKPDADWINVDKAKAEADAKYQQQQQQQQQAAAQGGGGKVICTQYHKLGYLNNDIFQADSDYGDKLLREDPVFVAWYWSWGIPLVRTVLHGRTRLSRLAIWIGSPLCRAWALEMAHRQGAVGRGSWVGRGMMVVGRAAFKVTRPFKRYPRSDVC